MVILRQTVVRKIDKALPMQKRFSGLRRALAGVDELIFPTGVYPRTSELPKSTSGRYALR
ncbi:hypothetical protein ADM96_06625 [Burkholderia sp. ST111]|nr:hypothetical protein ADM96_06625 [Burkholderia sp. ST111]